MTGSSLHSQPVCRVCALLSRRYPVAGPCPRSGDLKNAESNVFYFKSFFYRVFKCPQFYLKCHFQKVLQIVFEWFFQILASGERSVTRTDAGQTGASVPLEWRWRSNAFRLSRSRDETGSVFAAPAYDGMPIKYSRPIKAHECFVFILRLYEGVLGVWRAEKRPSARAVGNLPRLQRGNVHLRWLRRGKQTPLYRIERGRSRSACVAGDYLRSL